MISNVVRFHVLVALGTASVLLSSTLLLCAKSSQGTTTINKDEERRGKFFSLFSIVSFNNDLCRSDVQKNGTCYTSQECTGKRGRPSGSCAAGFGVCCVFTASATGAVVAQNRTYVRNPGFPRPYQESEDLVYTVTKSDKDVCALRLDFESFTIAGVTSTLEGDGGKCFKDALTVETFTGTAYPTICGENTGQHIYVEMGLEPADATTLNFVFDGKSSSVDRTWDIKASQIPCHSIDRPPEGCFQYHTGISGRFATFNFAANDSTHLANQSYNVCLRREAGFCCVEYQPCAEETSSFTLSTEDTLAKQDSNCMTDFVAIEDSSASCSRGGAPTQTKYCGTILSASPGSTDSSIPHSICDCTAPFRIGIVTDGGPDIAATNNTVHSRGICLAWHQVACF